MSVIIPVKEDFQKRLGEFIDALQEICDKKVSYEMGTKYVKIILGDYYNRQIHSFIDFSGNIYKAASLTIPAKHIRGSIYDDNYSIGIAVDQYGATSLR